MSSKISQEKFERTLNHLEIALYYADPPHPTAKKLLNEGQKFLDETKSKFPADLRRRSKS